MSGEVPPEINDATARLQSAIIADGRTYQEILLSAVAIAVETPVAWLDYMAEQLTHYWAAPDRPHPEHDWHVFYDTQRRMFVACSRLEIGTLLGE